MNEQFHVILDKARESLEAAELLYKQGYTDFAASRAYYAMFYTTDPLLLHRELSFSSHSAVIAAFGKEYAKTGDMDPQLHKNLIAVQDYRNQGDYGFGPGVTAEQGEEALQWASEFLKVAISYLDDQTSS